jgi:2-C-methyl-D-erythritol 4-phosphate cytidylyltransferase / 2-C-methyl-D-erythritol 2,4-cyclodiphosphate synthase
LEKEMRLGIVVVAGGSGLRFGADIPKQYHSLHGIPIIAHSIKRLRTQFPSAPMVLVQHPDHHTYYTAPSDMRVVAGGATRQASVYEGLQALAGSDVTHVLIHDAARPYVDAEVCCRLIASLTQHHAVIPTLPIADTVKQTQHNKVVETLDRTTLCTVQTPQAFDYNLIMQVHQRAAHEGWDSATDDAGMCERAGITVVCVQGAPRQHKITTHEDLRMVQHPLTETRVGYGYDVHRLLPFAENTPPSARHIRLCGVDIPHTHYLEGHSDADVVLHALTDALLGAIGEGDIGQHFPPTDASFKGMDSAHFLHHAYALVRTREGVLINADITLIGERPKISPYRETMRQRLATLLQVEPTRINVKATTTEKLGFEGRAEGLAAQAVVNVALPSDCVWVHG